MKKSIYLSVTSVKQKKPFQVEYRPQKIVYDRWILSPDGSSISR